jgi:hypothetical protein
VTLEFDFVTYDLVFAETRLSFGETIGAVWKLARSGVASLFRQRGFIGDVSDRVLWTAGYVVARVNDAEFQARTRKLLLDRVRSYKPNVILAHSPGSLVTYNAFAHEDAGKRSERAAKGALRHVRIADRQSLRARQPHAWPCPAARRQELAPPV